MSANYVINLIDIYFEASVIVLSNKLLYYYPQWIKIPIIPGMYVVASMVY